MLSEVLGQIRAQRGGFVHADGSGDALPTPVVSAGISAARSKMARKKLPAAFLKNMKKKKGAKGKTKSKPPWLKKK